MKSTTFENMNKFFDKVKTIGFFERIFGWKSFVTLSYDAFGEFQTINKTLSETSEKIDKADSEAKLMKRDIENLNTNIIKTEKECEHLKLKIEEKNKDIQEKESEIGKYKESDKKNTKRLYELSNECETLTLKIEEKNKDIQEKESENGKYKASDGKNTKRLYELSNEVELLNSQKNDLISKNTDLEKENTAYKKLEEKKQADYEKKVAELNSLKQQLDDDRIKVQDEREEEITKDIERQKQIWKNHEAKVEDSIKTICSRHQIEYLDKESVPFKGKPDNTVQICGEYIIFDAKSPQSDDLTNFKTYIRSQAEALKKYTKQKDVKRDIYLVIPFNTLEKIDQFYFNMTDYTVYVITIDSVEPILLSLKKIEEYEFAEEMSPDDRNQICRVIGKLTHATKRRIQVDTYFCKEFIEVLASMGKLPSGIHEKVEEFEKSGKLNPPLEKRVKVISSDDLKKEVKRVSRDVENMGINTKDKIELIEKIPLKKTE